MEIMDWITSAIASAQDDEEDEEKRLKRVMAIILRSRQMNSHFFLVAHLLPCFGSTDELRDIIRQSALRTPSDRAVEASVKYIVDLHQTVRAEVEEELKKRKGGAVADWKIDNFMIARTGERQQQSPDLEDVPMPTVKEREEKAMDKPFKIKTFDRK